MGNLNIGVMIRMLAGNETSGTAFAGAVGKTIATLRLDEEADPQALRFTFEDGSEIKLFDNGQSCCESRYMRTDDTLADYIGATLLGAEIKEAADIPPDDEHGDVHEIEFLEIQTSAGVLTMVSHNEHNGHYGGFSIECAAD